MWKKHSHTWKNDSGSKDRERWIEHILLQKNDIRIVEGVVYEFKTLYYGEKEWQDSQQHLIGYHYFILQHKQNGKYNDIEGFQGNIKDGIYHYFIYKEPLEVVKYNLKYYEALKLFNKRCNFDIKSNLNDVKKVAHDIGIKILKEAI